MSLQTVSCENMTVIWDNINNFLAIIGLISLLMTIVRVIWALWDTNEWIDNIIH